MSEALAGLCGELSLFEIDRRFAAYLREVFIERDEVELVEGDFLKTWRDRAQERGFPDRVLGNLPYNAASQIIAALLEGGVKARMVFTVQKEVGQRMMAQPGGKEYSSLSVLCALYSSVVDGGDVAAGSFFPAPHVVSKVVIVEPHERFEASLRERASQIARDAFAARRKTLRNALKSGSLVRIYDPAKIIAAIEAAGIDPSLRGESLGVDQYVEIANKLSSSSSEV